MSLGWLVLAFVVTMNIARVRPALPERASTGHVRFGVVAAGALTVVGLVALLAVFGDELLDALDISRASFRLAAGVVLLVAAIRVLLSPGAATEPILAGPLAALVPVAFPLLLTPELAVLTVAAITDATIATTLGAFALALVPTLAGSFLPRDGTVGRLLPSYARVLAVVLGVLGAALLVDAIRDV